MQSDYQIFQTMWVSGSDNRALTSPNKVVGHIEKILVNIGNYSNTGSVNIWVSGASTVAPDTENIVYAESIGNKLGSVFYPTAQQHNMVDGGSAVANEYQKPFVDGYLTITLSGVGANKSGAFAVYYRT